MITLRAAYESRGEGTLHFVQQENGLSVCQAFQQYRRRGRRGKSLCTARAYSREDTVETGRYLHI